MLRCSTERMASGHNTDRNTVAVLGALVRGRNAAIIQSRKPVRVESAGVTSAPYTGGPPTMRPHSGGGGGTPSRAAAKGERRANGPAESAKCQAGQYVSVAGSLPLLR